MCIVMLVFVLWIFVMESLQMVGLQFSQWMQDFDIPVELVAAELGDHHDAPVVTATAP
jgi:hypothetical protein